MTARKSIVPGGYRDRVLFLLMTCGIPVVVFFDFCVVAPRYHDTFDKVMWVHSASAAFILFNIYANLFKLLQTDTSAHHMADDVLLPGWRYCPVCAMNVPPRSHHCSVCNECILKHDHHCMFTGRCIGFYNQRYFVVALFYMTAVELICVARNQTTYEKSHGIRTYGRGLGRNLKEALGAAWFLVWLSPWVHSPVPGDFDGRVVCVEKKEL
ncbi:hypothetical protein MTO96_011434 [Rhipicephalus appendiculatus]